jgi:multidrug resistance efflux pump
MARTTGPVTTDAATTEIEISSPIDGRVVAVLASPGDRLALGDGVVSLDMTDVERDANRIEQDLAVSGSQQRAAQMALQDRLTDIDMLIDRKTMELRSLHADYARLRQPPDVPPQASTADEPIGLPDADAAGALESSMLAVQQAEFELAQLQEERWRLTRIEEQSAAAAVEDRQMLLVEALENRAQLRSSTIRATTSGVLIWVREAGPVRRGEVIARIASAPPD